MTTAVIVQARQGSSRLPNKVLADIAGKPMVTRVLERCLAIPGADIVVCAVPYDDHELIDIASHTVEVVPGDPLDVLDRYVTAARFTEAEHVMRITADCPLIDPVVCGQVLETYVTHKAAYASNVYPERTFPQGLDCEVFSSGMLMSAAWRAVDADDREHVTKWMQRTAQKPVCLSQRPNRGYMRWCVDTQDDLEFVRKVYEAGDPSSQRAVLDIVATTGLQMPICPDGKVFRLSDGRTLVLNDEADFTIIEDHDGS